MHPGGPDFTTGSEAQVWRTLRDRLPDEAPLIANLRLTDEAKDHEPDLLVVLPGYGAVVIEVKGGEVWHDGESWVIRRQGRAERIHPVDQARDGKYAVRAYVEQDPRWGSRDRLRWRHLVVLPQTTLPDDFELPDCPRWLVADATDQPQLLAFIRRALLRQAAGRPADDSSVIADILAGRGLPAQDLLARAADRDARVTHMTQERSLVLSAISLLHRVEVRGGAGSGKTWLALEQARRLSKEGQRVTLLCYSHGLASYLRRQVSLWPRRERLAYVGEYHALGQGWGARGVQRRRTGQRTHSGSGSTACPCTWPGWPVSLPQGKRFDAVVVDEAQDFAESWWSALLAALKDEEQGSIYVLSDEAQRVFSRFGRPPLQLIPILLERNLRNTKQIAESFNPLTTKPMRLAGEDGPAVRFVECAPEKALSSADDAVDALLDDGWRPQDVALLVTGSRHPEQVARAQRGAVPYWDSFWDADDVFYGHVLGFKGLERRAVVLAVNETEPLERSRERLYVGLSRARDELVITGDPQHIQTVAGAEVLRRLRGLRR